MLVYCQLIAGHITRSSKLLSVLNASQGTNKRVIIKICLLGSTVSLQQALAFLRSMMLEVILLLFLKNEQMCIHLRPGTNDQTKK